MSAVPPSSDRIHDRIADDYGYDLELDTATRLKHQLVAEHLRCDHEVLDVGCANGLHLRVHAPRCRRIVGIDLNEKMLDLAAGAAAGLDNVVLSRQDATALGVRTASVDVVYSFSTLLLVPDLAGAVREVARVLRPGGTAVLDFTGRYNVSQVFWRAWYRWHGHRTLHALSRRQVRALLSAAGLEVEAWHASGFTDQWKYVPVLRKSRRLARAFHGNEVLDRDYRISNRRALVPLANRWYVVARRIDGPVG